MVKYVLKRLGYILVTLWIIITCTFFLMKNLPGTPFDAERFSIMTPAQQEKVLEMYGLNDSVPVQYVKYIGNMLHGDLGTSFTYVNQDVASTRMDGQYGIEDVCLSIPAVIGSQGIIRTVEPELSDSEKGLLIDSANILKDVIQTIEI